VTALFDHALELRVLATLADAAALDVTEAKTAAERSGLTDADFHHPIHQRVWTAQMGLLFDGESCDLYRVKTRLKKDEYEAMDALVKAAQQPGTSLLVGSAIQGVATELRGLTLRRNIVRFGRELAVQAEGQTDPAALLSTAQAALSRITTARSANWKTLGEVMELVRREMADVAAGIAATAIPTGLKEWDRIIGGLNPGVLTVLGSHPAHGKSGVIARLILNLAALEGKRTAVFSLEDRATWIGYRALADASRIVQFILRNRKLTAEQDEVVEYGHRQLAGISNRIIIDDRGRLPASEIAQSARDAVLNHGAEVLVVDHWGEVTYPGGGDRFDLLIQDGLSDLRHVAKAYNVPIVVACHLKPAAVYPYTQHDFRNAAAFEQMSRVLVAWEKSGDILKMQVLKNTNGVIGNFELAFDGVAAMAENKPEPEQKPKQEKML